MKCGSCKGEHASKEEVKACYRQTGAHSDKFTYTDSKEVTRTPPPSHVVSGPTQNQRNYLTSLLEQTGKTEADLPKPMDNMTFKEVSESIDALVQVRRTMGRHGDAPTRLPSNIKASEQVMQGTYTVVFSEREGDYITLRFRAPHTGKWRGTQLVEYLYGPDNMTDYRRCANWTGDGYRVWADHKRDGRVMNGIKHMAMSDGEEQVRLGEVYALKSNNCWRCNRTLTVEKSITRGMGPICARIVLG